MAVNFEILKFKSFKNLEKFEKKKVNRAHFFEGATFNPILRSIHSLCSRLLKAGATTRILGLKVIIVGGPIL